MLLGTEHLSCFLRKLENRDLLFVAFYKGVLEKSAASSLAGYLACFRFNFYSAIRLIYFSAIGRVHDVVECSNPIQWFYELARTFNLFM